MPHRVACRGVTVAATALALTMGSAAVAYAEPAPLPPIPSPGDVLSTVPQTLTPASTSPVSQSAVSQSPVSQSPLSQSPATPTTPGQAPATVARGAARPVSHLVVPSRARAARPAYVARATSARIRAAVPTYAVPTYAVRPYAVPAALRLPPATELATSTAAQPTIAPLVVRPTGHAVTAGATRRSPAVDDGSLRALVVALALGAAAAVASGHLGRVRRSMR